jgi:hypothetical protein
LVHGRSTAIGLRASQILDHIDEHDRLAETCMAFPGTQVLRRKTGMVDGKAMDGVYVVQEE